MKTLTLLISILFFYACSDLKTEENSKTDKSKKIGNYLSSTGIKAINDLKKEFYYRRSLSRSDENSPSICNPEKYEITQIEYYTFDDDKFYQNPTPANLSACLTVDTNIICFEGKDKEKAEYKMLFTMKYYEDHWSPSYGILEWGKVSSWLQSKLLTDSTRYKIFEYDENRFVILGNEGNFNYYDLVGHSLSDEELCEQLLDKITRKRK